MIGAKILLLGSESPTDDILREIEILNQIIQDPTIDGLILTTPQVGAYNDIVKKLLDQGIPVATTNSFDPTIYMRDGISHTGQSAAAAAIGGAALAKCVLDKGLDKGSILFPSQTTAGNVEVNNRVTAAFDQVVKDLNAAGKLANFTVDAGPEKIGIAVNDQDIPGSVVTLLESRGDVVGIFGPNGAVTPAIVTAITQTKKEGQICAFGYDLGPQHSRGPQIRGAHRLTWSAAVPARLLAGHAALSPDRPRHRGGQSRHPRPARDQGKCRDGRQALRELIHLRQSRGRGFGLFRYIDSIALPASIWVACPPLSPHLRHRVAAGCRLRLSADGKWA